MNQIRVSIASLIVLATVVGLYLVERTAQPPEEVQPGYPIEKYLRYSFNLKNTSSDFIRSSRFVAFAPVRETSSQKVVEIQASHAYEMQQDAHGNQVMVFQIEGMPPYGMRIVTVTARVLLSETPNRMIFDKRPYLADAPLLSIKHPAIVAQGKALVASDMELGERIFSWTADHVQYSGFDPKDRGALYALTEGRGDCTEFSQLVTALLRQQNVPARTVGGFVIRERQQVLHATDYHNWSEYSRDGSWILADAQLRVHDGNYENYIAFRIMEQDVINPMSNSHRFLAFDQRLDVSMN